MKDSPDNLTTAQYKAFLTAAVGDPDKPLCPVCRRRYRKFRHEGETPRPDFAKKWKGWEWNPKEAVVFRPTSHEIISIDEDAVLTVDDYWSDDIASFQFSTPEDARSVAEAIAATRGGWREWGSELE